MITAFFLLVTFTFVRIVHTQHYCNTPLVHGAQHDCPPGRDYVPALQKCCGSIKLLPDDERLDHLPQPGQQSTIPQNCRPAITGIGSKCAPGYTYYPTGDYCCPENTKPGGAGRVLPDDTRHGGGTFGPGGPGYPGLIDPFGNPLGDIGPQNIPGGATATWYAGDGIYCASNLQLKSSPPFNSIQITRYELSFGGWRTTWKSVQPVCDPTHPYDAVRNGCCGRVPVVGGQNYNAQGVPGAGGAAAAATCVDKAVPGRPSDCPKNKNLCDVEIWRDLMTNQCPKTCGRCGQISSYSPSTSVSGTTAYQQGGIPVPTSSAACSDKAVPGRSSDCPTMAYLCYNPAYFDMMTHQCPATCGRCGVPSSFQPTTASPTIRANSTNAVSSGTSRYYAANAPAVPGVPDYSSTTSSFIRGCVDNIGPKGYSECSQNKHLCTDPYWREFMSRECKFTCKTCGGYAMGVGYSGLNALGSTTTVSPYSPAGGNPIAPEGLRIPRIV